MTPHTTPQRAVRQRSSSAQLLTLTLHLVEHGKHRVVLRPAGGPVHAAFIRAPWFEQTGPEVLAAVEVDGTERPVVVREGRREPRPRVADRRSEVSLV